MVRGNYKDRKRTRWKGKEGRMREREGERKWDKRVIKCVLCTFSCHSECPLTLAAEKGFTELTQVLLSRYLQL